MTLIPRSVLDIRRSSQNNPELSKKYVLNFLETDLDERQVAYFTYCINRLNAFRLINAQNYINQNENIIDRDNIKVEEVHYTEREIKSFIVLQNSSIFSPLEYNQLYEKYIENHKELKKTI